MNTYMTTFSKNSGFGYGSGMNTNFSDKNREKFERKEYEKGLFNVDERNK